MVCRCSKMNSGGGCPDHPWSIMEQPEPLDRNHWRRVFAGQAMANVARPIDEYSLADEVADRCIEYADALISQLEKWEAAE